MPRLNKDGSLDKRGGNIAMARAKLAESLAIAKTVDSKPDRTNAKKLEKYLYPDGLRPSDGSTGADGDESGVMTQPEEVAIPETTEEVELSWGFRDPLPHLLGKVREVNRRIKRLEDKRKKDRGPLRGQKADLPKSDETDPSLPLNAPAPLTEAGAEPIGWGSFRTRIELPF